MITLNETIQCVKHTPNRQAISIVAHDFDSADEFTFCESCEQNIERFSFYDEDRGTVFSKWTLTK